MFTPVSRLSVCVCVYLLTQTGHCKIEIHQLIKTTQYMQHTSSCVRVYVCVCMFFYRYLLILHVKHGIV